MRLPPMMRLVIEQMTEHRGEDGLLRLGRRDAAVADRLGETRLRHALHIVDDATVLRLPGVPQGCTIVEQDRHRAGRAPLLAR